MRQLKIDLPLKYWILAFLLFPTVSAHSQEASEPKDNPLQPNIFFVLTDDMGWGEIGATGNSIIHTPNLDQLYRNSLRFSNFHVAPSCAPTRAQIMSGRHNYFAGVSNTTYIRGHLRDDITILPEVLKQAGYRTGMFGKWHLGNFNHKGLTGKSLNPHDRGFDRALYTHNQLTRFDPKLSDNGEMKHFKGYCGDVIFEEAIQWSADDTDAPVFTYLATSIPHTPLAAPEIYRDLYKDSGLSDDHITYYAMISNIDENMGKLIDWIQNRESERDTILIFMTDNGHAISGPGPAGHDSNGFLKPDGLYNAGMRGGKSHPWHGGTCVPFLLHWPGVADRERDCSTLTSGMDILPTFTAIAGIDYQDEGIQGINLLPDILEESTLVPSDRILFTKSNNWRFSSERENSKYFKASAYTASHRLVWADPQKKNYKALYHYTEDRGETTNVIGEHPELVTELEKAYSEWWDAAQPEMVHDNYLEEKGEAISGQPYDPTKESHRKAWEVRMKQIKEQSTPQK